MRSSLGSVLLLLPWLPNDPLRLASGDLRLERLEVDTEPLYIVVELSGQLILDGTNLVYELIACWGGAPGPVRGTHRICCRLTRSGFHHSTSQKTSGVRISGAM